VLRPNPKAKNRWPGFIKSSYTETIYAARRQAQSDPGKHEGAIAAEGARNCKWTDAHDSRF